MKHVILMLIIKSLFSKYFTIHENPNANAEKGTDMLD